jgi:hypothetical protein
MLKARQGRGTFQNSVVASINSFFLSKNMLFLAIDEC